MKPFKVENGGHEGGEQGVFLQTNDRLGSSVA